MPPDIAEVIRERDQLRRELETCQSESQLLITSLRQVEMHTLKANAILIKFFNTDVCAIFTRSMNVLNYSLRNKSL